MNIRIANRLVEYRRVNGYSQEDLAEKLGVSRQAVSKWERAEASPDTDNLIALAALYGVTIDELINGNDRPHERDDMSGAGGDDAVGSAADAAEDNGENSGGDDRIHINLSGQLDDQNGNHVHVGVDGVQGDDDQGAHVHIDIDGIGDDTDGSYTDDTDSGNADKSGSGDRVHIGLGGIHVDDNKGNHVHIGLGGVHVDDEEGNHVHIGIDGININDVKKGDSIYMKDGKLYVNGEYIRDVGDSSSFSIKDGKLYADGEYVCDINDDDTVNINNGHVYVNGKEHVEYRYKGHEAVNWISACVPMATVIAYLVMGFVFDWGWRIGWLVFLLVPLIPSLFSAIRRRKPSRFAYPVLVAGVYLFLGLWFGWWHPWWILFLTIPLYYTTCTAIERVIHKKQ